MEPEAEATLASVQNAAKAAAIAQAETGAPAAAPAPSTPSPEPGAAAPPAPAPAAPTAAAPAAPAPAVPGSTDPAAPAGSTPAQPAPGSPPAAPTGPITIDINALSPEARRFLEMKGGDVNRALADALDYNNRLGSRGGQAPPASQPAAPAPGTQPATPAPAAPGAAPQVPPAAAPQPSEDEVVAGLVTQALDSDQESVALVQQYTTAEQELIEIAKAAGTKPGERYTDGVDRDIAFYRRRLEEPDVKADEFTRSEITEKLRDLRTTRADIQDRVRSLTETRDAYNARARHHEQRVRSHRTEEQRRQDRDASIESHAQALTAAWQPGIDRAVTRHGINPNMATAFGKRAWERALANNEHGITVDNLDTYLDSVATDLKAEWDEAHRARSAEYARGAQQRADSPTPAPPAAPSAQPQAPRLESLDELYARTQQDLRQRVALS